MEVVMKSILRDSPKSQGAWTKRATLLATFAAGLAAGTLTMFLSQPPDQTSDLGGGAGLWPGAAATLAEKPFDPEGLARDLAQIETDFQKESLAQKNAAAPEESTLVTSTPLRIAQKVEPIYPRLAKIGRFQGPVEVKLHVNERGYPIKVALLSGNAALGQAALEAAKKWRFHPAVTDGQPVPADFRIRFEFKLA